MFTSRLKAVDVPTLSLLLAFFCFNAFAGQYDNQCKQAGTAATQSCKSAVDAAKAADSAQSSAMGASAGQEAINPNSGIQGSAIGAQQGRLSQAQSACQAAKQQCSSKCDQAKQMTQKPPHSDAQKIPGTKASSCEAPIDAMLGELGQAQSELGKDGQGTEDTKNASQGGGMPPMSPPKGGDGKKDDQQNQNQNPQQQTDQQNQQQPGSPNCDSEAGARYSDCNERFASKCSGSMSQSGCEAFGERYCGSGSGASSSSSSGLLRPSFATGNTSGLVVDKRGEGLGSNFCRKYSAFKFCQQSGRGSCPSCIGLIAGNSMEQNSPEQIERARSSCPSDPIFADPTLQQKGDSKFSTQSTTTGKGGSGSTSKDHFGKTSGAGGASGGSGGGGLGGSAGSSAREAGSLSGESGLAEGHGNSLDVGAGGSGGGSSSGGDDSIAPFHIQSASTAGKKGGAKDSNGGTPLATDVARQQGPNLFSISTSTYQALCESRRINCRN